MWLKALNMPVGSDNHSIKAPLPNQRWWRCEIAPISCARPQFTMTGRIPSPGFIACVCFALSPDAGNLVQVEAYTVSRAIQHVDAEATSLAFRNRLEQYFGTRQ
jgi:hypothetical protein